MADDKNTPPIAEGIDYLEKARELADSYQEYTGFAENLLPLLRMEV